MEKIQKREQLKTILINKFRTKYNVRADADDFDQTIRREVENLMLSG
jgi:hypothetical protein